MIFYIRKGAEYLINDGLNGRRNTVTTVIAVSAMVPIDTIAAMVPILTIFSRRTGDTL